MSGVVHGLKEFYGAEGWVIVGVGLGAMALPGYVGDDADMVCHGTLLELFQLCNKRVLIA
jgi:hypothetical protein